MKHSILMFLSIIFLQFVVQIPLSFAQDTAQLVQRAKAGDADAQAQVGAKLYATMDPAKQKIAIPWLHKAAVQGNTLAQMLLGHAYAEGNGVEKDSEKAVYWNTRGAEGGNTACMQWLGLNELDKNNFVEAFKWAEKAANAGDAGAQYMTGYYYKNGAGVEKDMVQAAYWFEKSAEQNDSNAQCEIGVCYNFGYGVQKDFHKAFGWFSKAAKQGNVEACRRLGRCYEYGFGTAKDMEQAILWYSEAADKGDEKAKEWLAQNKKSAKASAEVSTKIQELMARAKEMESTTFVVGGFYVGMSLAEAKFLFSHHFPNLQVKEEFRLEALGREVETMHDGLWEGDNCQCFCRSDRNGKVIRFNFFGEMRDKFFDFGDISGERWMEAFIKKHGGYATHDQIVKSLMDQNNGILELEQECWRVHLSVPGRITYFGAPKQHWDGWGEDNSMGRLFYTEGVLTGYVNTDGGEAGTLRVE